MSHTPLSTVALDELRQRAAKSLSTEPRPFVRWAGSKRGLLGHIVPHLPTSYRRYYEPFLGSGALFFLLSPKRAVLSDTCSELIAVYLAILDDAGAVADAALSLSLDKETYYKVRKARSDERHARAGEFVYLNRGCFNGLYRVNSSGDFNVPWGAPKTTFIVEKSNLLACQRALTDPGITLLSSDFEQALADCQPGDLVFLDPPYVTRHSNNGFVEYNESLFSWQDQVRLARVAESLRQRGCHVLVTNAMHADLVALFPNFSAHKIARRSTLAAAVSKRGAVTEALFVGRGDDHG